MNRKNIFARSSWLLILIIIFSIAAPLSLAAPTSTGDNWKIVFDSAIDKPYNYSTTFTPKVWLYDQGGNPKTSATLTCTYFNVNDNIAITPCTVTNNGDGSYRSNALNMPTYTGKYINVLFSVSAGSYTMKEQHVFFAGQSNAAHGALWKIQVLNTSIGPSWNGNNQQKIYIKLYSDAGTPFRNNFNDVTIGIDGNIAQSMTYEEDGVYSYSISGYANGEHYFEVYNQWSGAPTGGARNRVRNTITYAGFYLEANSAQGDESSPEILSVERKPYFIVDDDYVNITVHAADNGNLASRTLYYTVNNQSVMTKSMDALTGIEYRATLVPYLLEDNIRYRVEVSDGTNSVSSDWNNYNVQDHRGTQNNSHSFLSHPAYWIGKSRQASFADRGGDTNFDGVYSTTEKDNAAYLSVPNEYEYFKDMTRIKVQTLILDNTGKPVQSLTNVKAWLSNNTKQSVGTHNREKNMTEDPSKGPGVYTVTWEGSADVSGSNLVWSDDSKAIWANYTSGEMYSIYIDLNNDGQPEENVTWLAYTFGDTYWSSSENGKTWGGHTDFESPGATCAKVSCHDMTGELTSRTSGSATCPDCHGVYKAANNGVWPVETGNSATEDKMVYGNGTGHPRQNNTNATYCGDETCHNVAWGSSSVPSPGLITIPGYPAGTRLNSTFRAEYPNPIQCGEHHNYTAAKIPVEEGHNSMVACKYCHGGSHDNNKIKDYSISIQGTNTSNVNRGTPGFIGAAGANGKAGDCYKDCHKIQVEHSLTGKPGDATVNYVVPCDECHQNFNNASVHQENMFPYPDREWCGTCHQAQGDLSSTRHNTSSLLDPPRIPAIQKHAQETGMRWNNTGTRPYWVKNEQSCRFCHGRSYNEAYGMGKMESFIGTNVLNGTINSTSHWCSSCHVNSSSQDYINMMNTYNYSFGVVPPEITGSTWKSNREGYDNHSGYVNRSNSSTYNDGVCFDCHKGSLPSTVSMDTWQHQVSASGGEDITAPEWSPVPTNQAAEYGTSFSYDVNATDATTITYSINDTTNFAIDSGTGLITNKTGTLLSVGIYGLNITATDSSSNSISQIITVTVQAEPTYSVSGYVFDNNNAGLVDVSVQNGSYSATTSGTGSYSITGLIDSEYYFSYSKPGFDTDYSLVIISGSNVINANKTIYDNTPPDQVTGLVNDTPTTATLNLSWSSTPNATYYQIFRNSSLTGTTQNIYWNETGLAAGTTYQYEVRANDSYNNWGLNSTRLDVTTVAGIGSAVPRVPQDMGLLDTVYADVPATECITCHVKANDEHHMMVTNTTTTLTCDDCHPLNNTNLQIHETDCKACHKASYGWNASVTQNISVWDQNTTLVNLTRIRGSKGLPHHNTTKNSTWNTVDQIAYMAADRKCDICHGSIVARFDDGHYVPTYNNSMISPLATFKINATIGNGIEWGGCFSCHDTDLTASPKIANPDETHHGARMYVGYQCNDCHVTAGYRAEPVPDRNPDPSANTFKVWLNRSFPLYTSMFSWDVSTTKFEFRNATMIQKGDTLNGTACEKCHSVQSLHNIQVDAAVTIPGKIPMKGHIGNTSDCNGCHSAVTQSANPYPGEKLVSLTGVNPGTIPAGVATDVTLTGDNLVEDGYTTVVLVDGMTVTPKSITSKNLVVTLSDLAPGGHNILVQKGAVKSGLRMIAVSATSTISSAKLASKFVTLTGAEFGPQIPANFAGYGIFVTHTATVSGKATTTTFMATIVSWTNDKIVFNAGTAVAGDTLTVKTLNGQAQAKITKK